jgi:hypothetical protein
MSMDSITPSKNTDLQTGFKRKTGQSVVYKKPTLWTETNIVLEKKGGKRFTKSVAPPKQAGVAILISEKGDFKRQLVRRDKEGYFILTKGVIQQEEIRIINLYVPIVGAPNFIKHILLDLKTQIDPNTEVVGDFKTPLSPTDRSSRQKHQ